MEPSHDGRRDGARCFLETAPLTNTKLLAARHGCDIAIPNNAGIGNIMMYTRIVEDLGRLQGRPLTILTARMNAPTPLSAGEDPYPLWRNNPFVAKIVDADLIDPAIMIPINDEMDNLCQFSHMIENIGYHYGLKPRSLRPALYLDKEEQEWAIEVLRPYARPILCVHPHGTSSSKPGHPWYEHNWKRLIDRLTDCVSILEIFKDGLESKNLRTTKFQTTVRQMMALVWGSDLFVGFDSSVAHVACAFSIPSVVLWDPFRKLEIEERWQGGFAPAALSRWGYPQNRNFMLLGDRDDEIVGRIVDWVRDFARSLRT